MPLAPCTRVRTLPRPRLRTCALVGLALATLAAGWAGAASTTTVVTMSVPSAISVTNGCTATTATAFGTVLPGGTATTSTGAGICSVSWTSTNDSSMLRIAQRDGTGTAMTRQASGSSNVGWTFFTAIDTLDGANAVAVGDGGTLARTIDSGANWAMSGAMGGNSSEIEDVELVPGDATIAWMVGFGGRVQRVSNLGGAWSTSNRIGDLVAQGWPAPGDVMSIAVISDTTVVVGGYGGYMAKTVNGGTNWTVYNLGGGTNLITSIELGPAGQIWATSTGNGTGNMWRSTTASANTAASWTRYNIGAGGGGLSDVAISGASNGYAVGAAGALWSWDGTSWTWRGDDDLAPRGLYDVASSSTTPGTAVAVGVDGMVLRTTTSGATWGRVYSPTGEDLTTLDVGTGGLLAGGTARSTIASTNGGASWTWQSEVAVGRNRRSTAVDPVDGKLALQVGSRGSIWRSTNGGATWSTVASGTNQPLYAVTFETTQVAWAVGANGTILRSADGGQTWAAKPSGTTVRLRGVSSGDVGSVVIIGDDGTIVRTSNGGTSFVATTPTTNFYYDVSMATRDVGVLTGPNLIMRTTDGGATWTNATSFPSATDVLSVYMASATTGYAGSSWSGLWRTTDGGATWSVVAGHSSSGEISDVDGIGTRWIYTSLDNTTVYRSADSGVTWGSWFTTVTGMYEMDVADDLSIVAGGEVGSWYQKEGSTTAGTQVGDYNATASNRWAPSAEGMFGVCVQGVGGTASAVAPFLDDPDTCTTVDTDPWQPVTTSPVKLASATASTGSVSLVFGVRFPTNQPPGSYSAGVVFEALAPSV